MISNISFLFNFLNLVQKKRFFWLLGLMIMSSFFEILSILIFMDYVSFLGNEETKIFSSFSSPIMNFLGLEISDFNIVNYSFLVVAVFLISSILSLITVYLSAKFSLVTGGEIETDLFSYYLKRDYLFHLETTSSKLLNNIFELVKRITNFILTPIMLVISKVLFIFPLILGLFFWKPKITLIAIVIFVGLYLIFFKIFKKKMRKLGELQTTVTEKKFSVLNTGFGAIKEIKILYKFDFFNNFYDRLYKQLVSIEIKRDMIGKFPKSIIELTAIFSSVLLILYFSQNLNYEFNKIMISMSFFLICTYKIIPALQQIYYHSNIIRNHMPALEFLMNDLKNCLVQKKNNSLPVNENFFKKFKSIEVKDLNFTYVASKVKNLKEINFKINSGQKIAITGKSGAGKTTLINILLGLIKHESGKIFINDEILNAQNLRSWQSFVGYVPQSIFLTEKSIKENIAFGVPKEKIDTNKIKKIIEITNLSKVVNDLPKKEDTIIGERGIKFSGGQQQRLGIARALYNNPSVVILDEATNALDVLTENEVFNSILNYKKNITIIMITHRLEVIKKFDKIIFLNNGLQEGFGSYEHLFKSLDSFNKLVSLNNKIYE